MTTAEMVPSDLSRRPKRADARRNSERLIAAARDAFADEGRSASLEDIARRAGVGIGTLYRHFSTRQELFEAVYVNEVEELCSSVQDLGGLPPWEALDGWLRRFVVYGTTKRAIAEELNRESGASRGCRTAIYAAGEPLLQRAQEAGVARPDVSFEDVVRLIAGITMMQGADPEQVDRVLGMALDGLRFQPPRAGAPA